MGIFDKIKGAIFGHKDAGPGNRPTIPAGMAGGPPAQAQPQPAGGQPVGLLGAGQRLPEGGPLPLGQRGHARHRPVADPPLGGVQDPAQRHRVGRVRQQPQVGEGMSL